MCSSDLGGKWTTYRKMAEDCVDQALSIMQMPPNRSKTHALRVYGSPTLPSDLLKLARDDHSDWSDVYGTDRNKIEELIQENRTMGELLHPSLPIRKGEVLWAVRHEWARSVEDVLARRTRALFLNAKAAQDMAPVVAHEMAQELGRDSTWIDQQLASFKQTAKQFTLQ